MMMGAPPVPFRLVAKAITVAITRPEMMVPHALFNGFIVSAPLRWLSVVQCNANRHNSCPGVTPYGRKDRRAVRIIQLFGQVLVNAWI
jgi:hypothetical protein